MLQNYFITAIRNLIRSRGFTIINVVGLAVGLTTCIFIALWITDEMSYDKSYPNSERLYRIVYKSNTNSQPRTPHPMPLAMAKDFPEVENGVSISPIWGVGLTRPEFRVEYLDRKFMEREVMSADSTFFQVFPFEFVDGDPKNALKIPLGIVITESTARKYFGKEVALGKTLKFEGEINFTVTGVIKDIPHNTHFSFDFLISYITLKLRDRAEHKGVLSDYYTWNDFGHYNYILLSPGTDPKKVEAKIADWIWNYVKISEEDKAAIAKNNIRLVLQPVRDIHLRSNLIWELGSNGNIGYVYAFAITALLVLLIAIFNYMNLATARSEKRAREVGVRKAIGAKRGQLIGQFLNESFLMTIVAFALSLFLLELLMPLFRNLTGKDLNLYSSHGYLFFFGIVIAAIVVGFVSGSYPSFFLTSFKPIEVLKGKIQSSSSNINLRKVLVVFQFSISIFLIICALGIFNQIQYLRNKDIGFKGQQIIVIPTRSDAIVNHFNSYKSTLKKSSSIIDVSGVSNIPGGSFNTNSIWWKDNDPRVNTHEIWVDDDFFKTLQIDVAQGRGFSQDFPGDSLGSFIVNETAVKRMNMTDPIGQEITWEGDYPGTIHGRIVGVVKDFSVRSLRDIVPPLIIQKAVKNWQYAYTLVRVKPENIKQTIKYIESVWKQFDGQSIFRYSFLDKDFEKLYESENRMSSIFWIFAALAIFVACLGLFGLAAFVAEQKTKEIGIRKVHGATTRSIIYMLTRNFGVLILISNVIAWPLAYIVLKNWLQSYAFKADINYFYFLLATLLTIGVGAFTTIYQSIRAARQNPVESLKYE
ncbi:MAG: ABC transporter permease [Bacteroidales bacterium]|nr:ABC transporter permease [Bacteroidales bacterium]